MTAIPGKCPSCQSQMVISQLTCTSCNTAVAGYYPLSPFAHLSEENLKFLEDFVRYRGNVKEMERETGVSYWTIRTRLDKLIGEMGLRAKPEDLVSARKDILEQLAKGEISAEVAEKALKELGK